MRLYSVLITGLMLLPQTLFPQPLLADGPAVSGKVDFNIVDFNRDIRPILSDTCFRCHGPDENNREAELRFDQKESVFEDRGDYAAVVPGNLADSELYQRLISDDADMLMPPPDSNRTLTPEQIDLFKRWIEQGASWQAHWSFEPVSNPEVPDVADGDWSAQAIDQFVLRRLREEGLQPAQPTDRRTIIRRVTFDLTGLPPTSAEVTAFVNDESDDIDEAYEKLVDRLLASPRYGEHMARFWLDAARYGDTHGLHLDNYREFWLYRDWVINAFNENKPYDQFTIEQLAGDLLEKPTDQQLIATGFNRAHVTTNEGGSIKEEVYVRNVVDRVSTTGTVFMGLTTGCAVCHDHKYDPITQKDFYSLFAFFNSLDGDAMDGNVEDHPPVIRMPSDEQAGQEKQLQAAVKELDAKIESALARVKYQEPSETELTSGDEPAELVWIEDGLPAGAKPEGNWTWIERGGALESGEARGVQPVSGKRASTETVSGLSQHFFTGATEKLTVGENDRLFAYVWLDSKNPPQEIMLQWNDGGWDHRAYWGENKIEWGTDTTASRQRIGDLPATGEWTRLEVDAAAVGLKKDAEINGWAFTQFGGTVYWDRAGTVVSADSQRKRRSFAMWLEQQRKQKGSGLEKELADLVKKKPKQLNKKQNKQLLEHFIKHVLIDTRALFDPLLGEKKSVDEQLTELKKQIPTSLIWKERKNPKPAYILKRGEYENRGDEVQRATPGSLPPFPRDAPLNRLGLAQWIVSPDHPLTARVAVNRFWQQVFGTGIVKTAGDFGAQGTVPTHPELLDWLANDFQSNGWDIKRTMKMIVMSSTYRQDSSVTSAKLDKDPDNRLLARGPRYRLDAEMLRDQALAVSGLLRPRIGGPSVKPPQPDGIWFTVGYSGSNTVRFQKDSGSENVHRRSLYTFWKRTAPPPQMSTFDAPSRESCSVRRERTNTPMQALMLMNDPQYVEAARYLAQRVIDQPDMTALERLAYMFERCTARQATESELSQLQQVYAESLAEYETSADAAKKLIAIGEVAADDRYNAAELAATTMVANLILNLDEVVTKN